MRHFALSFIVTILALIISFWWGGGRGLFICLLMIALDISFSLDNAVVNAKVLRDMSAIWQKRFLTWGMLIATFGMYYLFPILIVSLATGLNLMEVTRLAIDAPEEYSKHLMASHAQIGAFGGMFLLMVFLCFILDASKECHWLGHIEKQLARLGKLESVEVIIALALLLTLQSFLRQEQLHVLVAGTLGVTLYVCISGITALFGGEVVEGVAAKTGLASFVYLNLLDASFSLDAVVGSFAISNDIVIIMLGLSSGAMFVRSMTVHMVRKGTLDQYIYLEHGAHYAIGALAVIMLVSIVTPVSEIVTGLIGLVFIALSLVSSIRYNRKLK